MVPENKILFIYRIDHKDLSTFGIYQKLQNQVEAWKQFGYIADTITLSGKIISLNETPQKSGKSLLTGRLFSKIFFLNNILSTKIDFSNYEILIIRYMPLTFGMNDFFNEFKLKNPNCKILLDLPTYPYLHEYKGILKLIAQWSLPKNLSLYVDGILHLGKENCIFGVPVIPIFNACNTKLIRQKSTFSKDSSKLNLVYISSLWRTLGLKDVIYAIKEFNSQDDFRKINLTIIGEGKEKQSLKHLVVNVGISEYVQILPAAFKEDLEQVINLQDIGLGAVITEIDNNIKYTQALRHRLYASYGLPFITNVYDRSFSDSNQILYLPNRKINRLFLEEVYIWYAKNILEMPQLSTNLRLFAENNLKEEVNVKNILNFVAKS
jgi:hypothetical protein